jgi:hypothetical protein
MKKYFVFLFSIVVIAISGFVHTPQINSEEDKLSARVDSVSIINVA